MVNLILYPWLRRSESWSVTLCGVMWSSTGMIGPWANFRLLYVAATAAGVSCVLVHIGKADLLTWMLVFLAKQNL